MFVVQGVYRAGVTDSTTRPHGTWSKVDRTEDAGLEESPSGIARLLLLLATYDPPVVPLVARLQDRATGGQHILLELALAVQVVVPLVGGAFVGVALGALHDPGDERVLLAVLVPAAAAAGLLEGPDVDEDGAPRPHPLEQGGDAVAAPLRGAEVVDDGDADGEVGGAGAVGERQAVGDEDLCPPQPRADGLPAGEVDEGSAAVGAEQVQAGVDGKILAVAAADVEAD